MSSNQSPFLESISRYMAVRRYSKRTVESYLYWIKYYIIFHNSLNVPQVAVFNYRRLRPIHFSHLAHLKITLSSTTYHEFKISSMLDYRPCFQVIS